MRDGGKTTAPKIAYTAEERELLRNLVMRHRSVIENNRTDNVSKRAKDVGWEKVTEEYNSQPGIRRGNVSQLRPLWDNDKSKWKKMQSDERRNLYATWGGPSTCRPIRPSLALVGAAASHMAARLCNPDDSDGAHTSHPVLSLPPACIFDSMVTGSEDTMEELLGEQLFHGVFTAMLTSNGDATQGSQLNHRYTCQQQRQAPLYSEDLLYTKVEESTQHASSVVTQLEQTPSAPEQVVAPALSTSRQDGASCRVACYVVCYKPRFRKLVLLSDLCAPSSRMPFRTPSKSKPEMNKAAKTSSVNRNRNRLTPTLIPKQTALQPAPKGTSKNSLWTTHGARGRHMHQLDFLRVHQAASEEPQGTAPTILYRPKGRKNNFLGLSRDAIAAQLSRVPGAKRVRVNFRGNVVAVDCTPGAHSPLLTVQYIGQVEVGAKVAAKGTCAGVLYGVDPILDTETVLENLKCTAPVISCTRNGRAVVVRFAGSAPSAQVALFKHARSIHARRRRHLQCRKCGGYGHCDTTCTSSPRCLRCGGDHARAQCTETRAKCFHCNGNHPATEPRCPRWQHEGKILEVMASRDTPSTDGLLRKPSRRKKKAHPQVPLPVPFLRQYNRESRTELLLRLRPPNQPPRQTSRHKRTQLSRLLRLPFRP
ncbi:hypothetical protein HPB52_023348 [Rhipicephalus sanguineus]|uniref:Regulatory protein zeste n=1 Tax=Rhipicephalus sanguineus TaxID=34632 RepID=A0A9D4QCQ2_RHISA|nr:hypothetical protein HPB52_023348 [Rhipicephalus sanguineus]